MKTASHWCRDDHSLAALLARCQWLREVEQRVLAELPPEVAPHVRVAAVTDQCLVLQADSPAWAARLRFLEPRIIPFWRREMTQFPPISRVEVKVRAARASTPAPRKPRAMSQESREAIAASAESVSDPALREALARLARTPSR